MSNAQGDAEKTAVRAAIRKARASISASARVSAADAVARRLLALPELANARTVLVYSATDEELDLRPTIAALRDRGVQIAYPRICGPGALELHLAEACDLTAGPLGILQPCAEAESCPPADLDAVLVPGVAFDPQGWRLGYGGGYYDRLLPTLGERCVIVGVAFDEQVVLELPHAAHDIRMMRVVTPMRAFPIL